MRAASSASVSVAGSKAFKIAPPSLPVSCVGSSLPSRDMKRRRIFLLRLTEQVFGASGSIKGGEDHGFDVAAKFVRCAYLATAGFYASGPTTPG